MSSRFLVEFRDENPQADSASPFGFGAVGLGVDEEPKKKPQRKRRSSGKVNWDNWSTWEKVWRPIVGLVVVAAFLYMLSQSGDF